MKSFLIFIFLFGSLLTTFGQWPGTGSQQTTPATQVIINNTRQQNATFWFTPPNVGPNTGAGNYYIKAFDFWGPTIHFQGTGDNGNERMNVTVDGKFGIGVTNPSAKFHIFDDQTLGSNNNDYKLLYRVSGRTGNTFMNNIWLKRDASGSDWLTARLHNGISVDASYLIPGTDTKTWWERDPYNNIQSWGSSSQTYMTLKSGNVGIGTLSPSVKLEVVGKIRADYLRIDSENPVSAEGGEIMLDGANGYNDWRIDNYQGKFRLHHSGTNQFTVHSNGQVGIGTGNSSLGSHKLAVQGSIGAREVKVEATGWSDFVFENNYDLRTLEEVEKHINENGHLPEIPNEADVIENGINLGEMDAKLLQKIEELTLYMINMNKRLNELEEENGELKKEISTLKE